METQVTIPKSLHYAVKKHSEETKTPMRLIFARLIQKGLETDQSFTPNYGESIPVNDLDLMKFEMYIKRFTCLALDHLIMLRREIGIETKESVVACYGQLLDSGKAKLWITQHNYPGIIWCEKLPLY